MKKLLTIIFLMTVIALFNCNFENSNAAERKFTKAQQEKADKIAEVCAENWKEYGVLPSVAIAQAFVESTVGDHCPNNNLWGICSGNAYYGSLTEGIYGYMRVINNGYYKGAPHQKDYRTQLRIILDGGYCVPEGNYYNNAIWAIEKYDLVKYDKEMFKKIKEEKERKAEKKRLKKLKEQQEKEEEKLESETFTIVYDNTVDDYSISINHNLLQKQEGLMVMQEDSTQVGGFYDIALSNNRADNEIGTSNLALVGKTVNIEYIREAVG